MNLKNRKRVMMTLLSLMLTTTGCASKNNDDDIYTKDYKEKSYDIVNSLLDNSSFYNEDYNCVKDDYANLYQNYLDSFIEYMSLDQYYTLIDIVRNMNKEERNEYPETLKYMNSMFNVTDTSYGRGFYNIFNTRIIGENITYNGRVGGDISNHVNTLIGIVDNNEELFPSIFSGDINEVIDCIVKNTGIKNRELVEELILKMDLYGDKEDYIDYKSELVKDAYADRINEIIRMLTEAKCENDKEFADSLYVKLLRESSYYGKNTYDIIPGITLDTFTVIVCEDDEKYEIENVPKSYLFNKSSIEDIITWSVNDILARSFHLDEEEYYTVENTMQLLMCLIDSDIEFKDITSGEDFRQIIYGNLSEYFASIDEFNIFVLKLRSMTPSAFEEYFKFFIQSIKLDGITKDDFLRYSALVNYNNKRRHIYIGYFTDLDSRVDDETLANMTPEEYAYIANSNEENYLFGRLDYQTYFKQIEDILAENDLDYEMLYNKECAFDWIYGERTLMSECESSFISAEVKPEMMEYNGTFVIFYEYPEFYEDGVAVDVFTNINNETIAREREGFKAEIIDPETGNPRTIYVVDMGPSKDGYANIRFMIDTKTFNKTHESDQSVSKLTVGGQQ